MLKYIRFLKRLGKEKYHIASAKKALFMPLLMLWGVLILLFLFFGRDPFWMTVIFPSSILVLWFVIAYFRFFKIFGYRLPVYFLILVFGTASALWIGRSLQPFLAVVGELL